MNSMQRHYKSHHDTFMKNADYLLEMEDEEEEEEDDEY